MFIFKTVREQLLDEKRKSAYLQAALDKTNSDLEYLAMMTDVELDNETEEMEEPENEE